MVVTFKIYAILRILLKNMHLHNYYWFNSLYVVQSSHCIHYTQKYVIALSYWQKLILPFNIDISKCPNQFGVLIYKQELFMFYLIQKDKLFLYMNHIKNWNKVNNCLCLYSINMFSLYERCNGFIKKFVILNLIII